MSMRQNSFGEIVLRHVTRDPDQHIFFKDITLQENQIFCSALIFSLNNMSDQMVMLFQRDFSLFRHACRWLINLETNSAFFIGNLKLIEQLVLQAYDSDQLKADLKTNGVPSTHILSICCTLLREESYLELIRVFLQFIRSFTRLQINLPSDSLLIQQYYEDEWRLQFLDIDKIRDRSLVSDLRRVFHKYFGNIYFDDAIGRHGSGKVSDCRGKSIGEKTEALGVDSALLYSKCRTFTLQRRRLTSSLTSVPKAYNSLRMICKESTSHQFYQQAVKDVLYQHINRYVSDFIPLQNQEQNRNLALLGSRYGDLCTLDLSRASDSVSWQLVKRLSFGTPLGRELYATRSRFVETKYSLVHEQYKYAPMGSALCFPVECIIFFCVLETIRLRKKQPRYTVVDGISIPIFSVYGDDLIFPSSWFSDVVESLEMIGFIPNVSKSFNTGPYRESCGVDAYLGIDVTPIRLSRNYLLRYKNEIITGSTWNMLQQLCNELLRCGFQSERKRLLSLVMDWCRKSTRAIPFFSSCHWHAICPDNNGCKFLFNKNYQRYSVLTTGIKSNSTCSRVDDTLRYDLWLYLYSGRPTRRKRLTGLDFLSYDPTLRERDMRPRIVEFRDQQYRLTNVKLLL